MGLEKFRRKLSGAENRSQSTLVYPVFGTPGANYFLMSAPCKAIIEEVVLVSDTVTTASTAANHFDAQVANLTQSKNLLSTAESFVANDFVADTAWSLDPDQNNIVEQNDVIELQISATGTGGVTGVASTAKIIAQVFYRPV